MAGNQGLSADAKQRLERVVELAERIRTSSYIRSLADKSAGISYTMTVTRKDDGKFEVDMTDQFPDREPLSALVLTLRQFMQKNDSCSFGRLAEWEDSTLSKDWVDDFGKIRKWLTGFLDSPSSCVENGKRLIRREVLECVIYGELAHSTPAHRTRFLRWNGRPFIVGGFMADFHTTIWEFGQAVRWLEDISRRELGLPALPDDA